MLGTQNWYCRMYANLGNGDQLTRVLCPPVATLLIFVIETIRTWSSCQYPVQMTLSNQINDRVFYPDRSMTFTPINDSLRNLMNDGLLPTSMTFSPINLKSCLHPDERRRCSRRGNNGVTSNFGPPATCVLCPPH